MEELQKKTGYRFRDQGLLRQALTHSSYTNEHGSDRLSCNERLEFLGDAVLELASSEYLYSRYPDLPEGDLTKLRAGSVCEPALAEVARELKIPEKIRLGRGEETTGGRERPSIVSDALEALIGAMYLDGGFEEAKRFIWQFVMKNLEHRRLFIDSKTSLQEIVQNRELGGISYELISMEGPDHDRIFTSGGLVGGVLMGKGIGRSKKLAEQAAATEAVMRIRGEELNERGKDVSKADRSPGI